MMELDAKDGGYEDDSMFDDFEIPEGELEITMERYERSTMNVETEKAVNVLERDETQKVSLVHCCKLNLAL